MDNSSSLRGGYGIIHKVNYAVYSDALHKHNFKVINRIARTKRLGILPANTNIDAITYNGNLGASVSGVNYLQGPSADDLQGQRRIYSLMSAEFKSNGYKKCLCS
jgi:hypothetical protein